jgi:NTP pyrophosphatase (non-canonical NTP hydrolase)
MINETLNDQQNEVMLIALEECAEVIQAISKVFRFGIDSVHNGVSNKEHLEEEVGDLLCMIEMMMEQDILSRGIVAEAKFAKRAKLKKWSNIKEAA